MAEVIIFGGTTEGRVLAEYAHCHQVRALVSVASEYGGSLLPDSPWVKSRCKRLDEEQMRQLFREEAPKLVLDATHPYAVLVTENVKHACAAEGIPYVRVLREAACGKNSGKSSDAGALPPAGSAGIFMAGTVSEAAELLKQDGEPVLLTTGSKELAVFVKALGGPERIYARVLPDAKVLEACTELGVRGRRLIAMQGPFSTEMNCALIHMTGAGWLVTKESGANSGYAEKLQAARQCGIRTVVIRKPGQEQGISLEQAEELLLRWRQEERPAAAVSLVSKDSPVPKGTPAAASSPASKVSPVSAVSPALKASPVSAVSQASKASPVSAPGPYLTRQMALIGMGMGGGSQLTAEAIQAIRDAEAVFGAKRMLADVGELVKGKTALPLYRAEDILQWLEGHPEYRRAAVVYSGDTGFHSGCRSMVSLLEKAGKDCGASSYGSGWQVRVYPGISTVSCLCARFGTSYEDLYLASAHGQDCPVEKLLGRHRRVFLLLGEKDGVVGLCRRLCGAGYEQVQVYAGIRLGYPDEQLLAGTAGELCQVQTDALAAVILEQKEESHA